MEILGIEKVIEILQQLKENGGITTFEAIVGTAKEAESEDKNTLQLNVEF